MTSNQHSCNGFLSIISIFIGWIADLCVINNIYFLCSVHYAGTFFIMLVLEITPAENFTPVVVVF